MQLYLLILNMDHVLYYIFSIGMTSVYMLLCTAYICLYTVVYMFIYCLYLLCICLYTVGLLLVYISIMCHVYDLKYFLLFNSLKRLYIYVCRCLLQSTKLPSFMYTYLISNDAAQLIMLFKSHD